MSIWKPIKFILKVSSHHSSVNIYILLGQSFRMVNFVWETDGSTK